MTKTKLLVPMVAAALAAATAAHAAFPGTPVTKCAADATRTGTVCMDKFEASVWQIKPTNLAGKSNASLIKKVQKGTATAADLAAGDATQFGAAADNYPVTCPDTGQGCADLYAVSLPSVIPSGNITWFQAQQACANSLKRLPSNAEWQVAVSGADPGTDNGTTDCNTLSAFAAVNTGSRSSCLSRWGNFDMVGNLSEWVAEWVPLPTTCPSWGAFSNDFQCFAGASTLANNGPGALLRGGSFASGGFAGPLAVGGQFQPSDSGDGIGFRCAR